MNNQKASERYEQLIDEEDHLIEQDETYDQMIESILSYAYSNASNLHLETLKSVLIDIRHKNQQAQLQFLHVKLEKNTFRPSVKIPQ